jgi:succinate-acetate transporter protein
MATRTPGRGRTTGTITGTTPAAYPDEPTVVGHDAWMDRTRVTLTPVAAPSILGLFGFFAGTIMVGSHLAGWWGDATSESVLFPFAFAAGGIAQLLAGMWAYRARDGLATAMHGIWGAFWIGYGILQLLLVTKVLPETPLGSENPAFGMWFVALAAITMMGALGALMESLGLFAVLATLTAGSAVFAAGLFAGSLSVEHAAGWLFVISAACAWYVASALMLAGTTGRVVLPVGKWSRDANIPSRPATHALAYEFGEPGVKAGQ